MSDAVVRLMELSARHDHENKLETERLCSAQKQAQRLLETREHAHRMQVTTLQEQVDNYYCYFG